MKQEPEEYEDDGHTIANMNLEGMPWYRKEMPWEAKGQDPNGLTKEEKRWIILGAVKAALVIASFFIAGLFLVILLLCAVAWLRY